MEADLNAGKLDRRITLIRMGGENTPLGWEPAEVDIGKVWASRKDVSDREMAAAGAIQGITASRFVVRSSTLTRGLKPEDRLREGGLMFEITGIKEIGRNFQIEISAQARMD